MKTNKALKYGILIWLSLIIMVSLLAAVFKFEEDTQYFLLYYFLITVIVGTFAFVYFESVHEEGGLLDGLILGFWFVAIVGILDLLLNLVLYLFMGNPYIFKTDLLIEYLMVFIVSVFIGSLNKKEDSEELEKDMKNKDKIDYKIDEPRQEGEKKDVKDNKPEKGKKEIIGENKTSVLNVNSKIEK